MTDQFQKVAKRRARPLKRARDPESGCFEEVNPLNDPDLLEQCVRWVRAAEELSPILALLARQKGDSDEERFTRIGAKFLGHFVVEFRGTLLDAISFDSTSVRDATKPRVLTRKQELIKLAMERGLE